MRSAVVHDWLISSLGGSENCLQAIHEMYPSPIYTLLQNPKKLKIVILKGKRSSVLLFKSSLSLRKTIATIFLCSLGLWKGLI
jgi:hypothetical protein